MGTSKHLEESGRCQLPGIEWNISTGPRTLRSNRDTVPVPTYRSLTFHSARTSRASSKRPPRVLPTTIQMGTCQSSCLEISKVTCKGRDQSNTVTTAGLGQQTRTEGGTSAGWRHICSFEKCGEGQVVQLARSHNSQFCPADLLTGCTGVQAS